MKQKFTKFTFLFLACLMSASLFGQRFYDLNIDGIADPLLTLDAAFGPCEETIGGEMALAAPILACDTEPLINGEALAGKIAIVDRGSCNFTEKVRNAQAAGAIAVIVCNNQANEEDVGGIIVMGGDDGDDITIVSFMVSQADCIGLKASLPAQATFSPRGIVDTPPDKVLWGNVAGEGDFNGGLNGWSTATIECNGAPSELDTWKWDPDGILDEGALSTGVAPGPTFCNGMMAFDSDFLDNMGDILNEDGSINNGAVGTGPCPAPQFGELISPTIDLSGFDVSGVSLEFYQDTRQLSSRYFVEYSLDGGVEYTAIEINTELDGNTFNEEAKTTVPLPGAAGTSQLKVKFTYVGDYYYWIIDDVKIVEREANNLTLNENFFAAAPNVSVPKSQVDAINFLADVQNNGAATQDNTTISISVTDDATGMEVFSDQINLGSVTADSLAENNLLPNTFTPPAEVATYTGVYTVSSDSEDTDPDDNSRTIKFGVTEDEFANENGMNLGPIAINDPSQIPTWAIGNYFYVPKGAGFKVSKIGIGIGNADEVGGLDVGIRMFKWTDIDVDSDESGFPEAAPNERELVGFADYEILGNELPEDINLIAIPDDDAILLEDDAHYIVMMTMDAAVAVSATDELYNSYLAMNLASTDAGAPRYWSFFGNSSDVNETVYDANTSFTPLIRMYIVDEDVSSVPELSADNLITVSPNPAKDFVNLKMDFTKSFDEVNVRISDVAGRIVLQRALNNVQQQTMPIDISNLMSGTFMVNIVTPEGVRTEKFIKID